jgi:RNA polymerase sigma-70 factor (ECF subfamily)
MMGNRIVEPPDIKRIFDKPGRCWTPDERVRVWEWLFEDAQLRYLLVFARRHLGGEATAEDAEEAWGNFCVKRLNPVIDNYDPAKGLRFWDYLQFDFKRFCWDEGERNRKRRRREEPLEPQIETEEGEFIEREFADDDENVAPQEALERKERQRAVRECVNQLLEGYRAVIVRCYFEEKSVAEIAEELGISTSNVKIRLFRARSMLAACLEEKEWAP